MESSDAIGKLLRAEEKYVMVSISRFQIHRLHLIYVCMYGTLQASLPLALQSGYLRSKIVHHGRRQLRLHARLALLHTYIHT